MLILHGSEGQKEFIEYKYINWDALKNWKLNRNKYRSIDMNASEAYSIAKVDNNYLSADERRERTELEIRAQITLRARRGNFEVSPLIFYDSLHNVNLIADTLRNEGYVVYVVENPGCIQIDISWADVQDISPLIEEVTKKESNGMEVRSKGLYELVLDGNSVDDISLVLKEIIRTLSQFTQDRNVVFDFINKSFLSRPDDEELEDNGFLFSKFITDNYAFFSESNVFGSKYKKLWLLHCEEIEGFFRSRIDAITCEVLGIDLT